MRISDWSSDVCSSDLSIPDFHQCPNCGSAASWRSGRLTEIATGIGRFIPIRMLDASPPRPDSASMSDKLRPRRPKVIVTRRLPEAVETRMAELFDVGQNGRGAGGGRGVPDGMDPGVRGI